MRTRILYAGVDTQTLFLLAYERSFELVGVAQLEYFYRPTLNPANLLHRLLYSMRKQGTMRFVELSLLPIWYIAQLFTTGGYRRYSRYLTLLITHRISILDIDASDADMRIKKMGIDLLVVNAWGILNQSVLSAIPNGAVNIHPSKLPKYRGALPTLWSLKNGDRESAVSYILINEGIDAGTIIAQHPFEISEDDTSLTLEHKISTIVKETLIHDIRGYLNGEIIPKAQDKASASVTGKYNDYRLIDWDNERAIDIYNKVVLYPYLDPGTYCYFNLNGRKIELRNAQFIKAENTQPGDHTIHGHTIRFKAQGGILKCNLLSGVSLHDYLALFRANKCL